MKLFVGSDLNALGHGSHPAGGRRGVPTGGRFGRLADLCDWMLPLAGVLFLADIFSLVRLWPPLQYVLAGIVIGSFAGRSAVVWHERGGRELHPDLVRRVEYGWTLAGALLAVLAVALQVALA